MQAILGIGLRHAQWQKGHAQIQMKKLSGKNKLGDVKNELAKDLVRSLKDWLPLSSEDF